MTDILMNRHEQSRRYVLLHRLGPLSADEMNGPPSVDERRIYDIWRLNPDTRTDAIWYLNETHSPEAVLRRWLATNMETLKRLDKTESAITYALPAPFDDAWAEVKDESMMDWMRREGGASREGRDQESATCPRCGQSGFRNLPHHLRTCDG